MDLISIERKYKNKRNIIIAIFFIVVIIIVGLVIKENYRKSEFNNHYLAYKEQAEPAQKKQEEVEELEKEMIKDMSRQLTDEGKANLANIYHSETTRVFLPFDDGPSQTVTPKVLDTLKSEKIKATFFLLGSRVELEPDIVKREYEEGHYLASQGYSHV